MKIASKLVLALVAAATCGLAAAQSDVSDQQRRERNREEAIAKWEHQQSGGAVTERRDDDSIRPHKSVRENTQHAAQKTRSFTHRQLQKMRHFGARQDAQHPGPAHPARESNKAPTAIGK